MIIMINKGESKVTNIATTAQKISKMKKGDISAFLTRLYEKETDEGTQRDIAALYKHFEVKTTSSKKVLTSPIAFVNAARGKDEGRPFLMNAYFDGEMLVATDGYSLHYVARTPENQNLLPTEKGFYDTNLIKLDVDHTFPDFRQVINSCKGSSETITFNDITEDTLSKKRAKRVSITTNDGLTRFFDLARLLKAGVKLGEAYNVKYRADDAYSPLHVSMGSGMELVIMPVRR